MTMPAASQQQGPALPRGKTDMTVSVDHKLPIVTPAFLFGLGHERQEGSSCRQLFVANFVSGMPRQVNHLRLALTTADCAGARQATQALKIASQMVGAEQLAGLIIGLDDALCGPAYEQDVVRLPKLAAEYIAPINRCARRTLQRLAAAPGPQWLDRADNPEQQPLLHGLDPIKLSTLGVEAW